MQAKIRKFVYKFTIFTPSRRDKQLPFCKVFLPCPTKNPPGTDTRRTVFPILILQFLL